MSDQGLIDALRDGQVTRAEVVALCNALLNDQEDDE